MSGYPFELPIRSRKSNDGFYRIRGNNGRAICKDIVEKDEADYIAQSVNSHKALLEACEGMMEFKNTAKDNCAHDGDGHMDTWQSDELSDAFEKLQAALATAQPSTVEEGK